MRVVAITPFGSVPDGLNYYAKHLFGALEKGGGVDVDIYPWNYPDKRTRLREPNKDRSKLLARIREADILHVQYVAPLYLHHLFILILKARRLGVRVVITLHETTHDVRWRILWTIFQWTYATLAHALIVHTKHHYRHLPFWVRSKTIVIPHGVPEDIKRSLKEGESLLLIGFINPWKNYEVVLRGLSLLAKEGLSAKLTIAGKVHDQAYLKKLQGLAQKLDLKNIEWKTGFLSDQEFDRLFGTARAVILPYKRIAMSGVLTESIAREKIVLMSDLEPFVEYTHGKGMYFRASDPKDLSSRVEAILENSELWAEQKKLAASLKSEYSYANVARSTLNLYKILIDEA